MATVYIILRGAQISFICRCFFELLDADYVAYLLKIRSDLLLKKAKPWWPRIAAVQDFVGLVMLSAGVGTLKHVWGGVEGSKGRRQIKMTWEGVFQKDREKLGLELTDVSNVEW